MCQRELQNAKLTWTCIFGNWILNFSELILLCRPISDRSVHKCFVLVRINFVALSPGPTQLRDKIWVGPGDEAVNFVVCNNSEVGILIISVIKPIRIT